MARQRNPDRDKAMKIWLKSKGDKPLVDIAKQLKVSASTIRKWKSQDKWADKMNGSALIAKRSAPFDSLKKNKNAAGNSGGSAPPGNKNALTTGQYETIMIDQLSDDERAIFEGVTDDPLVTINTEIRQLKVRQYRITKRISKVAQGMDDIEVQTYNKIKQKRRSFKDDNGNRMVTKVNEVTPTGSMTQSYRKFDDLLKLEDALTAVGNSLLKAIKEKSKIMNIPYDQELQQVRTEMTEQQTRIIKYNADKLYKNGADNPIIKAMYEQLKDKNGDELNGNTD
ncbi:phage terminase small subunit [Companilactobacillus alimentarius]|uniref:phage terminase small subunit n=1 Tax=Companilactobacillus alimentarius TaxID=1602 RepID=UPI0028B316F2|nr:phage terminase small subunit [Companilactobacillus alimentarius]MDT6953207.1 phage terminase small subunit [Companilactobacillus alimentarius]